MIVETFRCSICPRRHRLDSLIGRQHWFFTVSDAKRRTLAS